MKKNTTVLLLVVFLPFIGYTQVTGYLGKKATLQINLLGFPALLQPTVNDKGLGNNYDDNNVSFGLNYRLEFQLGYTIARYKQLVIASDYFKTGMKLTAYTLEGSNIFNFSNKEHHLFYALNAVSLNVNMKKFFSDLGALAPFGQYWAYGLHTSFLKGTLLRKNPNDATVNETALGIQPQFTYIAINLEYGKHSIYFDHLLVNLSIRLSIPIQFGRML